MEERFITPECPEMGLIQLIHRDHDGYISFHRRHPHKSDGIQNLCSVPARALPGMFEQMVPDLDCDAYFGINGFYRGKQWHNRFNYRDFLGRPLSAAHRDSESVRYLTSCFVDIDCMGRGIDVYRAIGEVIRAQDEDVVPLASIMTRSGRGIWLFWLLTGMDYRQPSEFAKAWPERCELWHKIQAAIGERLAALGSDPNARDLARISRIPGSLNSKVQTRVAYWVQHDEAGKLPLYTLTQLGNYFGIASRPAKPPRTLNFPTQTIYQQRAAKGRVGRWLRARANFERLWAMRGGFRVGTRNNAALYYTIILKNLPGAHRLSEEQVEQSVLRLHRDFEQPTSDHYSLSKLLSTVRQVKPMCIRNQTIADGLDVTPEEATYLLGWPPSTRFGIKPPPSRPKRPDITKRRQCLIMEHIRQLQLVPPSKVLADHVEESGLKRPSRKTILADLRALGIPNPRGRLAGMVAHLS